MQTLKLQDVTVNVGETDLLKAVSVNVNSDEILAVIGPNGSGKTTLLRAISCDIELTLGSILIVDQPIRKIDSRQRACQLAVLPQFSSLSFPFTVEQVVELSRIPHNTGKQCDRHIVKEALRAMDVSHLQKRLYTHLSGGEKQRVQLARTMAQIWRSEDAPGARILLLDEPTSALDLGHQQQLMQTVRCFANQGVAVIMTVHDINLASHYADNILALSGGSIAAYGRPKDIISKELIKKLYAVDARIMNYPKENSPVVIHF